MRIQSQILPALRPGSADRFPVSGPQALRNACKAALGSPGGVTDTVTIEYANTDCITNNDFADAMAFLWDHEEEHAIAAEEGVDAMADPYVAIEGMVGSSALGVRAQARTLLTDVNTAAILASAALDVGAGPGYEIWLPGTNGTWDDPTSVMVALFTKSEHWGPDGLWLRKSVGIPALAAALSTSTAAFGEHPHMSVRFRSRGRK
jgi:hypothetical protein